MRERIEEGMMAFLAEGQEAIGGVRRVHATNVVVYVENHGDFDVPFDAVKAVHDGKVMLDAGKLGRDMRTAIGHAHDDEDPNLAG